MAGLIANAVTTKLSLTASTQKTLLQITAPTNHRVKVLGWSIFFDEEIGDATPSIPLTVTIGKQTGGTGSVNTPVKIGTYAESVLTSAKDNFTVEPTVTAMSSKIINAQTGYEILFPMGQEVILAGSEILGITVTPGAIISTGGLKAIANILFEE